MSNGFTEANLAKSKMILAVIFIITMLVMILGDIAVFILFFYLLHKNVLDHYDGTTIEEYHAEIFKDADPHSYPFD